MAFVYMLECSDGSFYVGSTVLRLEERLHQHQEGLGAAYTARRRPVRLVWHEEHEHVGAAFAREKQIQNWGRPQRLGGLDHRTMRSSANTRWHTPPVVRLDREDEARGLLEAGTYAYFATGAGVEETVRANLEAWREWWLRPHGLRDVTDVDLRTTVLGVEVSSPVMVAPTAFHRLAHPDGEVATARATGEVGGLYVLSTRATVTLDDVTAVAGPWWLQVYVLRDRGVTAEVVRRAVEAGARALVLTVDTPVVGTKRRETDFDLAGMDTLVPGLSMERDDDGLFQAPDVTYDDIGWLRDLAGDLPVAVKGVVRADDARAAVEAGASAVWVSNHGGRQLDGCVPTAAALPEVVDAVGEDVEVYVDGGIRHGRDVLRALALGARAVAVGRPVLWALAADGGPGVRDLLTDFAADLVETLQLAGVRSPAEVTRDLVVRRNIS